MSEIVNQQSEPKPELTDYNKLYNTPGGNYYDYPSDVHPLSASHPAATNTITGYGPLDYGYGMTPSTTMTVNAGDAGMVPFSAPPIGPGSTASAYAAGGRRASILDMIVGVKADDSSSSNGGSDSKTGDTPNNYLTRTATTHSTNNSLNTRRRSSLARFFVPDSNVSGNQLGRRRSSTYLSMGYKTDADGNEHKGPYADVSRAQAQHMERLREVERNLHRTHNIDGLPLPQENTQRRRSSLLHFLRLDKPILAR
ncbi:hypothetical protein BGX28_009311 [Mortierella sp. GBA30]|nr:hypothetical protein BGX28_009311 [Mortierella sp. GBA30]